MLYPRLRSPSSATLIFPVCLFPFLSYCRLKFINLVYHQERLSHLESLTYSTVDPFHIHPLLLFFSHVNLTLTYSLNPLLPLL